MTREPVVHSSTELTTQLARALPRGAVPLLVLRMPPAALAHEPQTANVFARAAQKAVRDGDALVHDPGSDWFGIAMFAPSRSGGTLSLDARSALERIGATMSLASGARMETGWWPIASERDLRPLERTVERALERGARERERFEFLAAVGHELRTPLTSIRGYLETVLDDELDAVTTRRFLEVARNEALRLGRLVDGILDFSPLDISPAIAPGSTDVAAALAAAVEALLPISRDAGIEIRSESRARMPARIAHDACMHVLLNVIENAIKYGRRGGSIIVCAERQDPFVCAIVDDDGPGIDPPDRERIFAHRTRGAAAASQRGSGLGLAIVRSIVERAGGSVSASASPLGGARFTIRFPADKAEFSISAS